MARHTQRASVPCVLFCTCVVLLLLVTSTDGTVTTNRVYEDYTDHPCIRPCPAKARPMECKYQFYLEYNMAMGRTACRDCPTNASHCLNDDCITADGKTRWIMTVNRRMPGPAIHVCQGDTIVVRVTNDLLGTDGTTIHWHGIRQRGHQHMDGASRITQCQIPVTSSFEYRFPANDAGTHFWHAHSGSQQSEGIHGALVVRQPARLEPHLGLYDRDLPEHTLVVTDWLNKVSTEITTYNKERTPSGMRSTLIVNGRRVQESFFANPDNRTYGEFLPITTFTVERGRRYRFRVVDSGVSECPIQISIDSHTIKMIASDGSPFEPVDVDSFFINNGERYDFVLHADQPVGNYWIRFQGTVYNCGSSKAYASAILKYAGAPDEYPPGKFTSYADAEREGMALNKWNVRASPDHLLLTNLTGLDVEQEALKATPDKQFYLRTDIYLRDAYRGGPSHYSMINEIALREPPVPPLTQWDDLDKDLFCNEASLGNVNCTEVYCECVYLEKVALGDVVELVVVDEGSEYVAVHPWHLHGHKFYVVGIGKLGVNTTLEEVKRLDSQGKLPRKLDDPVAKDSFPTNDGGYVILRWHATNPGFWVFHCLDAFHILQGQGLVFQVGEISDMPPVPKGFPRCGDWAFSGYDDGKETGGAASVNRNIMTAAGVWMCLMILLS